MDSLSSNGTNAQILSSQNNASCQTTKSNQTKQTDMTADNSPVTETDDSFTASENVKATYGELTIEDSFDGSAFIDLPEYDRSAADAIHEQLLNPAADPPSERAALTAAQKCYLSSYTNQRFYLVNDAVFEHFQNRPEASEEDKAKYFYVVRHLIYSEEIFSSDEFKELHETKKSLNETEVKNYKNAYYDTQFSKDLEIKVMGDDEDSYLNLSDEEVDRLYDEISEKEAVHEPTIYGILDYSAASTDDIAAAVDSYARDKGYNVPEGFGQELVTVCSEYNIDYGLALAICAANDFGQNDGSLMGFESITSPNGTEVSWQEDLRNSAVLLAQILQKGSEPPPSAIDGEPASISGEHLKPSSASDSIASQISAVASQVGSLEWASEVYNIYGEEVCPALSDISGVQNVDSHDLELPSDYHERLEALLAEGGPKGYGKLKRGQTLYDVIAEKDGISPEDAKALVDARLIEIQEHYQGRNATCMSILVLMEIAADYGVKLRYDQISNLDNPDGLAKNIDPCKASNCCCFASWALDKGCIKPLLLRNVGQLSGLDSKSYDESQGFSPLQPGDIIICHDPEYDKDKKFTGRHIRNNHVMIVVENVSPEDDKDGKGYVIVAESGNGVQVQRISYTAYRSYEGAKGRQTRGYTCVNASSVYEGTADCYNQYLFGYEKLNKYFKDSLNNKHRGELSKPYNY